MPSVGEGRNSAQQSGFFIPDLCNVQALFLLVLVGQLLALVFSINSIGLRSFSLQGFAMTSLFVQWTVLLSAAGLCQLRPRLANWQRAWAAALSYTLVLATTALVSVAAQFLVHQLPTEGVWHFDFLALADNLLISAVLAGIALRYFYLAQELRQRQRAELEARIQALQSRIRPHFLFNSMNSIASLIGIDPVAAEAAVEDLAVLFRASLAQVSAEVTFAEELELCRRYVRIEQLRLGDRLHMDWRVDAIPGSLPIPGLSLQPLLENAIYHGIQARAQGGTVSVYGAYQGDWVELEVTNPVAPAPTLSEVHQPGARQPGAREPEVNRGGGNHMALDNIGRRLQALYGDDAGVSTGIRDGQFRARLFYRVEARAQA